MINKIFGRAFKGLDFDQPISKLNLFVGRNGIGKSARSQALQIAILGYLPTDQAKQPGAIHATHASGPEMIAAVEINGHRFSRRYRRAEDGAVSLDVSLDGKRLNQKQTERALIDMGNPQIFDLRAFNDLSGPKKIEYLLSLFPPAGNLRDLEQRIVEKEDRERFLREEVRGKRRVIEQLTGERAALQLPAGTLAELQEKIRVQEGELSGAQEDLKNAEIEEEKRLAEERAKTEAKKAKEREEGARADAEAARQREAEALKAAEKAQEELKETKEEMGRHEAQFMEAISKLEEKGPRGLFGECLASLQTVKETLEEAGCTECAALLVLKMEMNRLQETEAV